MTTPVEVHRDPRVFWCMNSACLQRETRVASHGLTSATFPVPMAGYPEVSKQGPGISYLQPVIWWNYHYECAPK